VNPLRINDQFWLKVFQQLGCACKGGGITCKPTDNRFKPQIKPTNSIKQRGDYSFLFTAT